MPKICCCLLAKSIRPPKYKTKRYHWFFIQGKWRSDGDGSDGDGSDGDDDNGDDGDDNNGDDGDDGDDGDASNGQGDGDRR